MNSADVTTQMFSPDVVQHFLFTRFNLRNESWNSTKNANPVLTEEWLEKRFDLFERFCLPSVKAQINQNFRW